MDSCHFQWDRHSCLFTTQWQRGVCFLSMPMFFFTNGIHVQLPSSRTPQRRCPGAPKKGTNDKTKFHCLCPRLEMHLRCILSPLPRLKKGPNDAPGVVWAIIVRVFFISFRYFFSLTDIFSLYLDDKQPTFSQIAYLTSPLPRFKKGPNDAPGVV